MANQEQIKKNPNLIWDIANLLEDPISLCNTAV